MSKTNSQYVAESRERALEQGRVRAQAFMFSERGSELYRDLREDYGSEREMLEAGLEKLAKAKRGRG